MSQSFANKVDANQKELVSQFRKLGYSVLLLNAIKGGCPDALVAKHGENFLVEFKSKSGKLNELQEEFIGKWNANVFVVRSIEDIIKLDKKLLAPIKNNRERY
jgi:Holliday junction resolvase